MSPVDKKRYSASAVKVSFWFAEFRKVMQMLDRGYSMSEIRELNLRENIFSASTPLRAKQIFQTVSGRVLALDADISALFLSSDLATQKLIALVAAMAYDERDGWTAYAVASGISAKSVVLEKYLLGLICPVLCTLFAIIIYVCMGNTAIIPEIISYALCYPVVIEAICLPIVNKTGVEKGRALMIVAVLLGILFYILISSVTGSVLGASAFVLLAVAFITAVAAVIISYSISLCVFGKKEF